MRNQKNTTPTDLLPLALMPVVAAWLAASVLRETPVFWRNSGGYPVALRSLLLHTYWIFTVGLILGCGAGAVCWLRQGRPRPRFSVIAWLVLAGSLGAGLAMAGANNFVNLMEGRPLHYHPPRP